MSDGQLPSHERNPHRSAEQVRRLTYEQLGLPAPPEPLSDAERWEKLEALADDMAASSDVGVAVRTVNEVYATGRDLTQGETRGVHALELAIWKAYSEDDLPVTDIAIIHRTPDFTPCTRCLQVVTDYGTEPTIRIRSRSADTWEEHTDVTSLRTQVEGTSETHAPEQNTTGTAESREDSHHSQSDTSQTTQAEVTSSGSLIPDNVEIEYVRLKTPVYHLKYKQVDRTFCGHDLSDSDYNRSDREPELLNPCKSCHGETSRVSLNEKKVTLRSQISDAVAEVRMSEVNPGEFDAKELQGIVRRIPTDFATIPSDPENIRFRLSRTIQGMSHNPDEPTDFERDDLQALTDAISGEGIVPLTQQVYVYTSSNKIKRVPIGQFDTQRRAGKGYQGIALTDTEKAEAVFTASPRDHLLLFTNFGTVYRLPAAEIPERERTDSGVAVTQIVDFDDGERLQGMLSTSRITNHEFIVFATRDGTVKRTKTTAFTNIHSGGIKAIELGGGTLRDVAWADGTGEIVVTSSNGYAIRFNEAEARPMTRSAHGVQAIQLDGDDTVVGMEILPSDAEGHLLTLTRNGYGKRSALNQYKSQTRNGRGLKDIVTNDRNGTAIDTARIKPADNLLILSSDGRLLHTTAEEITVQGRNTMGVKAINLSDDATVVDLTVISPQ